MRKYLRIAQRRFRFGLRTLLIVPVLLSAVLAWWVTWPHRSAARFVNLMGTDIEEAEKINSLGGTGRVLREYKHDPPYLEPHSRSLAEVLLGKQTFTVVTPLHGPRRNGREVEFTATMFFNRGKFKGPVELNQRPKRKRE
jgi:hypothetical protein